MATPTATLANATTLANFVFDEAAFKARSPYPLIATNLKGAYATPAPPDTFDPKTASQSDLMKNGLMWRKPAPGDPPSVQAAWDKFFSRKWLAQDRIVPESHPQVGVTHNYRGAAPKKQADSTYTGTVWSGAGTKTGKWTSIIGYWKIPTVSEPSEPQGSEGGWNSSSWVGLDGFFYSNDVLQAGVQQRVLLIPPFNLALPVYVAWYEWFAPPQASSPGYIYQTNIGNFAVSPGDQVYCSVQYNGTASGSISFANENTGKHFSITLAPPPGASFNGQSCEWILEAPDGGEPISSLPKFTPVTFTSALACGPGNAVANPQSGDILNIESAGGRILTKTTVGTDTCTIGFIG
ncbi:MAG TPA: G1 family glutamic endopeptidase [Bryobacteraceae bacterium]|nr:G1 family glutamic endopeptidase [Bryobacteraceae bacterium]